MKTKLEGRVDMYAARGWGFIHHIAANGGLSKYWFHVTSFVSGEPCKNARVTFTPSENTKGPIATEIEVLRSVPYSVEFLAGGKP